MRLQPFFDTHPVFNFEEFVCYMQQQKGNDARNLCQQLNYHHKAGHLIHIRKFLYAVKPASIAEQEFWIDPYLIAGKVTSDAVLTYHSALELHNLAYTTFEELTFSTRQSSKPFVFQNQRFRPTRFPKALMEKDQKNVNVESFQRQGIAIRVTNVERTIVDVLDRPELAGGWEEVWRSLDHVMSFDPKWLVDYALCLNNATTIAKVGFFLEQRPPHLKVDQHYIDQLLPFIPKQKHYISRSHRIKGKYIKKWQLIVPVEIIERRWEELYALSS